MFWDVILPERVDLVHCVIVLHVEGFALLGLHESELFSRLLLGLFYDLNVLLLRLEHF